jgi:hypothetical protein
MCAEVGDKFTPDFRPNRPGGELLPLSGFSAISLPRVNLDLVLNPKLGCLPWTGFAAKGLQHLQRL